MIATVLSRFYWPQTLNMPGVLEDIPYCPDESEPSNKHKLDIFLPMIVTSTKSEHDTSPPLVPVVVIFHSGGWQRGDRKHNWYGAPVFAQKLSAQGFVCVVVSYRLSDSPEVKHPDHIHDVSRAVVFVKNNIQRYGGDPDNIFLVGHSAGGHLAALVTLDEKYLRSTDNETTINIRGAVCVSGIYTLRKPFADDDNYWRNRFFRRAYVVRAFGTDEKIWEEASPINYVRARCGLESPTSPSETEQTMTTPENIPNSVLQEEENTQPSSPPLPQLPPLQLPQLPQKQQQPVPPFLLLQASVDLGLEIDGMRFATVLVESNVDVELHTIPRTNHRTVISDNATVDHVVRFVRRFARTPPSSTL